MIALVFEGYGALCFISLIAFLVLAAVAKLRPDLDEEELDFIKLEKESSEQSADFLSLEPAIMEVLILVAAAASGKAEQAADPKAAALDLGHAQAAHDLSQFDARNLPLVIGVSNVLWRSVKMEAIVHMALFWGVASPALGWLALEIAEWGEY